MANLNRAPVSGHQKSDTVAIIAAAGLLIMLLVALAVGPDLSLISSANTGTAEQARDPLLGGLNTDERFVAPAVPVVSRTINPELRAMDRFSAERSAIDQAEMLRINPELRTLERYRAPVIVSVDPAENPELRAFERWNVSLAAAAPDLHTNPELKVLDYAEVHEATANPQDSLPAFKSER